jgi:uncharacterized protein YgiM (DUF1202 family)
VARREEDGVLGIPVMKLAVIGGVGVVVFALLAHRNADASQGNSSRGNPQCAFTVDADVLNVRAGPSTADRIVGRLVQSQSVTAKPLVRNGFRQLDETRWASVDYLAAASGTTC